MSDHYFGLGFSKPIFYKNKSDRFRKYFKFNFLAFILKNTKSRIKRRNVQGIEDDERVGQLDPQVRREGGQRIGSRSEWIGQWGSRSQDARIRSGTNTIKLLGHG